MEQIATALGYKLQNGIDDHALREWYLSYFNHAGAQDRLQVEINFLMRACALAPRTLPAASLLDSQPCEFPVLATEELFGGKIKAMIDRRHPRDLDDLFRFANSDLKYDPEILRAKANAWAVPRLTYPRQRPNVYALRAYRGVGSQKLLA